MNKKTVLVLCLVLAALMIGAGMLYTSLADEVQLGGLATTPPETTQPPQPTETAGTSPTDATEPDYSAPDFTMLDWEGGEVTLSEFFGKPIVLNFWASWCGPCKMEMPDIQKYYEKFGEEIHFLLVSVDDSVDTAKAFIEKEGYTFPVYFDTTSAGAYTYGASSIPLTYFIDTEGNMQAYYMGAMSEDILQQGIDMIYTQSTEE